MSLIVELGIGVGIEVDGRLAPYNCHIGYLEAPRDVEDRSAYKVCHYSIDVSDMTVFEIDLLVQDVYKFPATVKNPCLIASIQINGQEVASKLIEPKDVPRSVVEFVMKGFGSRHHGSTATCCKDFRPFNFKEPPFLSAGQNNVSAGISFKVGQVQVEFWEASIGSYYKETFEPAEVVPAQRIEGSDHRRSTGPQSFVEVRSTQLWHLSYNNKYPLVSFIFDCFSKVVPVDLTEEDQTPVAPDGELDPLPPTPPTSRNEASGGSKSDRE